MSPGCARIRRDTCVCERGDANGGPTESNSTDSHWIGFRRLECAQSHWVAQSLAPCPEGGGARHCCVREECSHQSTRTCTCMRRGYRRVNGHTRSTLGLQGTTVLALGCTHIPPAHSSIKRGGCKAVTDWRHAQRNHPAADVAYARQVVLAAWWAGAASLVGQRTKLCGL